MQDDLQLSRNSGILNDIIESMGLPGKRNSRSSKRRRAAHFAMKKQSLVLCAKCERSIMPHRACSYCGTYKGREVLKIKTPKLRTQAPAEKKAE